MLDSELCSIWSGIAQKRSLAPAASLPPAKKPYDLRFSPRIPIRARLGADKALFEAFTASAQIPLFNADRLPPMKPLASYNDDVVLEHYTSASRTYLWDQRRGIIDDRPDASPMKELALEAL